MYYRFWRFKNVKDENVIGRRPSRLRKETMGKIILKIGPVVYSQNKLSFLHSTEITIPTISTYIRRDWNFSVILFLK